MVSFLKLRRQCGVSHEVRQGAQGASLMAPGKSGLHVRGKGVRVISIEPWKQIRASRHQTQRSPEGPRHLHRIPRLSEAPWEAP